jgi:hypothetical protein
MFNKPRLIIFGDQDGITGKIINKQSEVTHSFSLNVPFSLTNLSIDELEHATEILSTQTFDPLRVLIIVDGKLAIFRSFITSFKSKLELKKGLEYELSSRVPMPLEQIRWDYKSDKLDNGFFVNVGGVKKEHIHRFLHLMGKLRVKPNTMTIEPMLLDDYVNKKFIKKSGRKEDLHIFFLEDAIHYLAYQNGNYVYYRKISKDDFLNVSQLEMHTDNAIRETGTLEPSIVHYVIDQVETDYQIDESENSVIVKLQDHPLLPFR